MAGILAAYGIVAGEDRPDVVVSDATTGVVTAIGEAKFFTNETDGWRSALRDAAVQMVGMAEDMGQERRSMRCLHDR